MTAVRSDKFTVAMPVGSFFPTLGGAQVGLHNIAIRLIEKDIRPVVLAPWKSWINCRKSKITFPYEIVPLPPKFGSLLARLPRLMLIFMDRYLAFLDWKFKFDYWHCTYGYPIGISVLHYLGKEVTHGHLVRCVGDDIQIAPDIGYGMRLDPRIDALVRQWLPRAETLVAITDTVAEEYRALGVSEERIKYIPNGVDLDRFDVTIDRQEVRQANGLPDDAFIFLSVGRYHPKKDFAAIIEAMAMFEVKHQDSVAVVIAGQGVSQLANLARTHEVENKIILIDTMGTSPSCNMPEVPSSKLIALYKCADVFVFPSLIETFGIAIVEAMAAGLPVITTDAPGCRDVIREGRDGLMVDAGDRFGLLSAMTTFAENDELRHDYTQRSIARAQHFSWDAIVEKYVNLYHQNRSANYFLEPNTQLTNISE